MTGREFIALLVAFLTELEQAVTKEEQALLGDKYELLFKGGR